MKTLVKMFWQDMPLRRKLVLAFLAVSVLSGASLVILSNWVMKDALNRMMGDDLHNLATAKALAVGNRLARQVDVLHALSLNPAVRDRLRAANAGYRGDAAAIRAELAALDQQWLAAATDDPLIQTTLQDPLAAELQLFQHRFPNHVEVFLTDAHGGLVAATGRTEDYYQADEPWWPRAYAQEAGGVYIDTLAWDPSSAALGVRIAAPVFDQDETTRLGVLVSIYRLDILYQLIGAAPVESGALDARLLLPDGQVLAAGGQSVVPLAPADLTRLQTVPAESYAIRPFEGTKCFMSLAPVATLAGESIIADLGWRVLVCQEQQAALTPLLVQQRVNFAITLGALAAAALAGLGIAYNLSRPIMHLTTTAQRIAAGDMTAVAPVSGRDEIGTLAATFNAMTTRLQKSMAAIQASETRFRSYIEAAPIGIFEVDAQGRYLMVNPTACRMIGYTETEFLRMSVWDLGAPETQDDGRRFRRLVEEGRMTDEVLLVGAAGQRIPVMLEAVRLDPDHYLAFCTDITAHKQAELALRASELRFNEAQRIAHIGSWELDLTTGVLTWSDEIYRIFEIFPDDAEVSYAAFLDLVHPADRAAVDAAYTYSLAMHIPYEIEHRLLLADDRIKFVYEQCETTYNAAGKPLRSLGTVQDITERKQAEAEREELLKQWQESEYRIRQIMNTVPEGVVLLDANLRVQLCNPTGNLYLQILTGLSDARALTCLGDIPLTELLTSPPQGLWHTLVHQGRHFQAIARAVEIGPTMQGWVLVIRDVTNEYEVQERLQRQERLAVVGQLAAGIAHDFNNILAGIMLYSQMSLQAPDLSPKLRERFTLIADQSRHAADLIVQILDFSRRSVLDRQPLDLTPLLKEQVKLWERTLPENIHIALTGADAHYTISADLTRIQQALMNLVVNARDAMPNGGQLRLDLARLQVSEAAPKPLPELTAGEWVQLTVTDTGTGIPDDVLPHIFEPFFTTKAPGKGSGLGLPQVYGITRAHDGWIGVRTQPGAGTTFALYLPALSARPAPVLSSTPETPLGHGETILVVEDNAITRAAVKDSLELLHYCSLEAADGMAALELFARRHAEIALVLSDMVMPKMSGKALAHALHQMAPELPVVFMSGHPLEEQEDGDLASGVRAWIQKPVGLAQLAEILAVTLTGES